MAVAEGVAGGLTVGLLVAVGVTVAVGVAVGHLPPVGTNRWRAHTKGAAGAAPAEGTHWPTSLQ